MILLSAVCLLVSACLLLLLFVKSFVAKRHKQALQQQLHCITLSAGLKELLVKIQQHRGMVMTFLKGDETFKDKLADMQEAIAQSLNSAGRLTDQNSAYGRELSQIEEDWRRLQQTVFTLSSAGNFIEHSRLIERLLNFLIQVAEQNQLQASNRFAAEYVNIIWQLIPTTAEALGKARAIGSGMAAATESKALDRIQLGFLINKIRLAMQQVEFQINKVSETGNEIRQSFSQINYDVNHLISLMETQLLAKEKGSLKAGDFFDQATGLLNKIYALYDQGEIMVVSALESDLAQADGAAKFTMGSALISTLLVTVSAYFIV